MKWLKAKKLKAQLKNNLILRAISYKRTATSSFLKWLFFIQQFKNISQYEMKLFIGLGNPGSGYESNRHNIGFMVMDELSRAHNFQSFMSKFSGQLGRGKIQAKSGDKEDILLLKPDTFMNRSGISASQAASFYKIQPKDIFVFYDDMDLELGKVRVKIGGGDGGHNGIKSLDQHINKNYNRVRIGIGRPEHKSQVTSHVLSDFNAGEHPMVELVISEIVKNISALTGDRADLFMNNIAKEIQKHIKASQGKNKDKN